MSNKQQELDELILEVLKEAGRLDERLPIAIKKSDGKEKRKTDINKELGVTTHISKDISHPDVAKRGSDNDKLDVDDFVAIFKDLNPTGSGSNYRKDQYKFAQGVYDTTVSGAIKQDLHKAQQLAAADADSDVAKAPGKIKNRGGVIPDYIAATRASYAAWDSTKKTKAMKILEDNKALGATLAAPDINLNQYMGDPKTPNLLLDLAAKRLAGSNNIEIALQDLCRFLKQIALGTYKYKSRANKDKIGELLSRMMLTQALLSATQGFEESPMGFLMEGFFAILLQGSVKGSNQEAEDLIHEDPTSKKITLYSFISQFKRFRFYY